MALSGYKINYAYKTNEFEKSVNSIQEQISRLKNNLNIEIYKNDLNNIIQKAREREKGILSSFNNEEIKSMDDLRKHLLNFKKDVIEFSNQKIAPIYYDYKEAMDATMQDFSNQINYIIQKDIMPAIDKAVKKNLISTTEQVEQFYLQWLHQQSFGSGRFSSTTGLITDGLKIKKIIANALSPAQLKSWEYIMNKKISAINLEKKEKIGRSIEKQRQLKIEKFRQEVSQTIGSSTQDKTTIGWYWATNIKKDQNEKLNILVNEIINMAKPQSQGIIRAIIQHMLNQNPNAFYAGENAKDIVGILGEIQGTYYILKFKGIEDEITAKQELGKSIIWRGGTIQDKAKPHTDILINGIAGVQVKNTIKNQIGNISFRKASIKTILDDLNMLSDGAKQGIANYFSTKSFNIPYDIDKSGKYIRSAQPMESINKQKYLNNRDKLKNLQFDVEQLLYIAATSLMYLDINENFSGKDLNFLYLIGGSAVYSAAEILEQLQKSIDTKHSFKINEKYSLDNYTIVEAFNEKNRKAHTTTDKILEKLVLTSSFNFKDLLK